jgi:hypothetical protein
LLLHGVITLGRPAFFFQAARRPVVGGGPVDGPDGFLSFQESANLGGVELFGEPKGPAERSTTLCQVEAPRLRMQPRSPTGEATPRIGYEHPIHSHDTQ